jgi:hypothetical protein
MPRHFNHRDRDFGHPRPVFGHVRAVFGHQPGQIARKSGRLLLPGPLRIHQNHRQMCRKARKRRKTGNIVNDLKAGLSYTPAVAL